MKKTFEQVFVEHPDKAIVSTDDIKCRHLLASIGLLERFQKSDEPGTVSVVCSTEHKTHYIIGVCWSGNELPDENGYAVYCLPKRVTSPAELKEVFDYVVAENKGHDLEKGVILLPDNWRQKN